MIHGIYFGRISHHMYFSFIFPVCNEQECLEKQLCFFYKELIFNKIKCREILLVENGSSDRTGEIINNIIKSNKLIKERRKYGSKKEWDKNRKKRKEKEGKENKGN